jgi:TnpA family transposase
MAHRQLLTDEERQALLGIPLDADSMARCFTLSCADQELVAKRRRDANRIGFAVQLALLRHPGIALTQLEQPAEPLVQWLATQLEIPAAPFAGMRVARRP